MGAHQHHANPVTISPSDVCSLYLDGWCPSPTTHWIHMRGGRKRRRETARSRESMVDVHLSCIIAVNASTAILALETMWGGGRWVLLKSLTDSSSFSSLLPLLFSKFINAHTHKKSNTLFLKQRVLYFFLSASHTPHTILLWIPQEGVSCLHSSGHNFSLTRYWWSWPPLQTNPSLQSERIVEQACGYNRGNVLILLDYSPHSHHLLSPLSAPTLSPNISPSVACGSPVVFPVSVCLFTVLSFSSRQHPSFYSDDEQLVIHFVFTKFYKSFNQDYLWNNWI